MRTIAVVTAGRSDYSIYRPILKKISCDPDLKLFLIATGTHLSPEYGMTIDVIEEDGFTVASKVEMLLSSDNPVSISKSIGIGTLGFAQVYSDNNDIDLIIVLGDRFEMLSATVSALPFNIPVAHIHGGECTFGVIDESIRHCITKMSHVHFTATEEYSRRLIQLGEDPRRIFTTGAPSLDNLHEITIHNRDSLSEEIGMDLRDPFLIVTFHPVTLGYEDNEDNIATVISALRQTGLNIIFTYPNPDTSSRQVIRAIEEYSHNNTNSKCVTNLGLAKYFSLMAYSCAMVGNSSSGIIEAASFGLPVVNIGERQAGRVHGKNVLTVECTKDAILSAITEAIHPKFIQSICNMQNPYGNGSASGLILSHLKSLDLSTNLIMKKFHSIEF